MNNSRITNVANAVADSDAVNFGQLKAWSGFDTTRLDRMDSRMDGMQNQINTNMAAIAGVTAATNLPGLSANQRYNFGLGYGNFANYNGIAVGGHARLNENVILKVSGSAASGIYSGGAGMSLGF
jgi:autotransporter adhesin